MTIPPSPPPLGRERTHSSTTPTDRSAWPRSTIKVDLVGRKKDYQINVFNHISDEVSDPILLLAAEVASSATISFRFCPGTKIEFNKESSLLARVEVSESGLKIQFTYNSDSNSHTITRL